MWNEAMEYPTSLGRVLIHVRNGPSRGFKSGTSSQTKLQSAGQPMKTTPGNVNVEERAPFVKDADVSFGEEQSNHSGDGGALAIGDEEIEEIPAPTLLVETASSSSTPNSSNINYPEPNTSQRTAYKTSGGKTVTQHQWDVYDFIRTIPKGKVVTYKDITVALRSGSPRSVGTALRNNPFAPDIPCHRVIASNLYVGGYCGEWGPQSKSGTQYHRKLDFLREEGVRFDGKGKLLDTKYLWDRKQS